MSIPRILRIVLATEMAIYRLIWCEKYSVKTRKILLYHWKYSFNKRFEQHEYDTFMTKLMFIYVEHVYIFLYKLPPLFIIRVEVKEQGTFLF